MFADAHYLETLWLQWQQDPQLIDPSWSLYFEELERASKTTFTPLASVVVEAIKDRAEPLLDTESLNLLKEERERSLAVHRKLEAFQKQLIRQHYREKGYLIADLYCLEADPWSAQRRDRFELELEALKVASNESLDQSYAEIYASRIGFEPPSDPVAAEWFYSKLERESLKKSLPTSDKQESQLHYKIWQLLERARLFEEFLHQQFVGQKRFSLEGEESLLVMLEAIFEAFSEMGGTQVSLGMSHRGRLNVLAHSLKKSYEALFREFGANYNLYNDEMGDVKYHRGYRHVREIGEKRLRVELLANPSHLESIDAVLMGFARAQQRDKVALSQLPILLHGDGAFTGQGVVYESLQLSGLEGYSCCGTLHIIVNNQIGFTATASELRTTPFCSDLARTFSLPVLHVRADDPLACLYVAKLSYEYRQRFGKDIVIDLIGFRRWGHNEGDEPRYTQPELYEKIDQTEPLATRFAKEVGLDSVQISTYHDLVIEELQRALNGAQRPESFLRKALSVETPHAATERFADLLRSVDTRVDAAILKDLIHAIFTLPEELAPHSKLKKLYADRLQMLTATSTSSGSDEIEVEPVLGSVDWGSAELLAYGSLLKEGHHVRLSGQDSVRGTFSHRHCGLWDRALSEYYFPLSSLKPGRFEAVNSPLSEFAVLGFEYGYSLGNGDDLVIWEAQFGDFANGAQVIIDQYVAACHSKWLLDSRLVLFLPHGFEGQGPEHSSARMERFLALSARANWCIANVTSPAQLFHLLRRQIAQPMRRPLVLFTPKSLLRHPKCQSRVEELSEGSFQEMIVDSGQEAPRVLVMCSGRLYYELHREMENLDHVALMSIEQLYPFSIEAWRDIVIEMQSLQRVIWIQEEPINMGAASWIRQRVRPQCEELGLEWLMIGREEASSVATGYPKRHEQEQALLYNELREQLTLESLDQGMLSQQMDPYPMPPLAEDRIDQSNMNAVRK